MTVLSAEAKTQRERKQRPVVAVLALFTAVATTATMLTVALRAWARAGGSTGGGWPSVGYASLPMLAGSDDVEEDDHEDTVTHELPERPVGWHMPRGTYRAGREVFSRL